MPDLEHKNSLLWIAGDPRTAMTRTLYDRDEWVYPKDNRRDAWHFTRGEDNALIASKDRSESWVDISRRHKRPVWQIKARLAEIHEFLTARLEGREMRSDLNLRWPR